MANLGRYTCVAVPFLLTLASLIALLVSGLAGVTNKSLDVFQVNTTDFSISLDKLESIISSASTVVRPRDPQLAIRTTTSDAAAAVASALSGTNITAAQLGLAGVYKVSIWNYCADLQVGNETCSKPQFDWATNTTAAFEKEVQTAVSLASVVTGSTITLPAEVTSALNTFSVVVKWTEVAFIIAYVALGLELIFGFFANCSRAVSCVTFIVAGVATVSVVAAASLATALGAIVVGTIEGAGAVASGYGLQASLNTSFLAAVWAAAAFAIAAGFFWMFTICCCAPEHRARRRGRTAASDAGWGGQPKHLDDDHAEKLVPQTGHASHAYFPVSHAPEEHGYSRDERPVSTQSYGDGGHGGDIAEYGQTHPTQQSYGYGESRQPTAYHGARTDLAYEPYATQHV